MLTGNQNDELVLINMQVDGKLFDLRTGIEKQVGNADFWKCELNRVLKQNAEIAAGYLELLLIQ